MTRACDPDDRGMADALLAGLDAEAATDLAAHEYHEGDVETDPVAWVEWAQPKIEHKVYGQVVFRPYIYQKRIMRMRARGTSFVCEKSRQTGVSTAIIIADTHALLYSRACFGHIIAQKEDVAKDRLLRIAKRALETCVLQPGQKSQLRIRGDYIEFGPANYLRCHTGDPNASRSFAGNRILLEEAAYMEYGDDIWKAVCPMIDDHSGQIAVVSTYNGEGDFFCRIVDQHEELGLDLLSIDWRAHPDRDEAWKRQSIARFEGSEDEWREEHELRRLQRGDTVVDVGRIEEMGRRYADICIGAAKHPVEGHEYILGSDVGGGGRAHSVNVAIDMSTSPPHLAIMDWAPKLSFPDRKVYIEAFYARFPRVREHWVDGGGPGADVVEMMERKPNVMIITGGSAGLARKRDEVTRIFYTRIPRDRLLLQGGRKLESASVVIPPWHKRAYMALRSARWGGGKEKRSQSYNDEMDGLMIALWDVPELNMAPRRGTGPVSGLASSDTLTAILGTRF